MDEKQESKVCENCREKHDGSFGSGRFCSRSCASKRIFSEETKNKLSIAGKRIAVSKGLRLQEIRLCEKCGKKLNRTNTKGSCRFCLAKYKTNTQTTYEYRKRRKRRFIEYKGGKCQICGYNRCDRAMDFHHLDPSKKSFEISITHNYGIKKIFAELEKCILVCCRCHREIEDGLIDLGSVLHDRLQMVHGR